MDQLERRNHLIKLRLESLERRKLVLKPHERWPTVKSVRQYQERNSNRPPMSQSAEAPAASQPTDQDAGEGPSTPKSQDTKTTSPKPAPFPFPISQPRKSKAFPQFSNLPPEIRILIWENALYVPKFIEAQFCTQFYQPAFVNYVQRDVMFSVCHESRAVAFASAPDIKSLQALTFKPHPTYRNRLK
jgi:2EXR family